MNPILVVGASVGGSTAANTLALAGIPVVMLEKDLSWVKPCGGALPPVAFTEFDIPERLISRKVRKAWIHSPTERIVEIEVAGLQSGRDEYVAMACREELDPWLRERAVSNGAELIEGKLIALSVDDDGVTATYRPKDSNETVELRASAVIGADGAYSTTAKLLGLERVPYCVAIQERFHVPDHKLGHWSDTADLYLGETVSPDLYAWAFPKADHVAVGCGAGPGKTKQMRQLLENLKERIADKLDGCEMMMEEAHALPIHPRKKIAFDRVMLVG
ncbi:MAG: FAD-dependent monooxygenase, partial [Chloroflexota bacterium]